ncbi:MULTISPECIES: glycoside hydrolase family 43 protein [Sphingobacterium]|uniref:Glycoside hydrolase family 43 protein n=1 Tax=Sphingobacterium populi TaxID=1812824 RepID=A0ABW5UFP1_9SPHI|nr:glycoside hydrolase family 43 protein [Sphingobacterium sp. CFCC 11742]
MRFSIRMLLVIILLQIQLKEPAQAQSATYDGYLFAYFEGDGTPALQEQLRFAVSHDAQHWYALHNNQPILNSSDISSTGGIRDPHILRGAQEDGFYLTCTDMNTVKNGWETNPGIVLLHSNDLISWKSSIIDLAKLYPKEFGSVKWVWAPQTIYDPSVGKYMVYFTVRKYENEKLDFYYAYANADFSGLEEMPKLLFAPTYGGIDGDIIFEDGVYHFFYKGNTKDSLGKEFENGIKKATSYSLLGPWKEEPRYLDVYANTKTSVEGSSIFKLNNADEYYLMYDLYTSGKYAFQRSRDLVNFSENAEFFEKNFHPRHGSVISIYQAEAARLSAKWSGVPDELLKNTY